MKNKGKLNTEKSHSTNLIDKRIKKMAKELYMIPNPDNPNFHFYSESKISETLYEHFPEKKFPGASIHQWSVAKKKGIDSWKNEYGLKFIKGYQDAVGEKKTTKYIAIDTIEPVSIPVNQEKQEDALTPEIIDTRETSIRSAVTSAYERSRRIYDKENQIIENILDVNLGELGRLVIEHGGIDQIPPVILNKSISKGVQRLIFSDALKRAVFLEQTKETIADVSEEMDLSTFTEQEILKIARGSE